MRWLALILARPTWWGLLWLMRRPWMRRAQLAPAGLLRGESRATFVRRHFAQNKFARRIGLGLLTIAYEVLIGSALLSVLYQGAIRLIDGGYVYPEALRARRAPEEGE